MSFARFMDLALYCPDCGYYETIEDRIGRRGDFYTSVSAGRLFGQLLAVQFLDWHRSANHGPLLLVEAGAHDGQLGTDILDFLRKSDPDIYASMRYVILEPSARRRAAQATRLSAHPQRVRWTSDLQQLAELAPDGIRGIVFGNEFLDALPFRRWRWDKPRTLWVEQGVAAGETGFQWVPLPQNTATLVTLFPELADEGLADLLPSGAIYDQSTGATAWWHSAVTLLEAGWLLALDYGYTAEELIARAPGQGTLRAYRKHQLRSDVLANPGEQDLTGHVNFSDLIRTGKLSGWTTRHFVSQSQFLGGIAARVLRGEVPFGEWSAADTRTFQTLTHPAHLGASFRVLAQYRARS